MKAETLIERMKSRMAAMKVERSSFIPHWQEISKFIVPRTSRYMREDRNRGDKVNQSIINETATLAHRTLQSGLMAGMSSAARPWFTLGPADPGMKEYGPVKEWLETVTRILRESFVRSNLYTVLPFVYGSEGAYGSGAFAVLEDDEEVFRCYPFPIGSFVIDCNDRMQVDTCYREFSMTVKQLIQRFGAKDAKTGAPRWDNFSSIVKSHYDRGNYGAWIPVVHAVEPNLEHRPKSPFSWQKPYASVYYEEGADNRQQPLRMMGYNEFPIMVPRWHVNGEDVWGSNCPAMDALGSVKALQLEERRKYQALDKLVNPAVNADATLRNVGVDLLPGGINWVAGLAQSANAGVRPVYEINPYLGDLKEDIREVEYRIRRCFYEDLMLMLARSDNPQMTAREIEERHEEKMWVLGPMLEQQNDDLFDRLIDRAFAIHLQRGLFPPPPQELQGKPLRVEYISIMAQAQKLVGVATLERFIGFVGSVAAWSQGAIDKVDVDHAIDEYAEMTGVSPRVVVSDDDVDAIREGRARAQQAQQMMASLPAVRDGAQAAKLLSETNASDVSALSQLMTGVSH